MAEQEEQNAPRESSDENEPVSEEETASAEADDAPADEAPADEASSDEASSDEASSDEASSDEAVAEEEAAEAPEATEEAVPADEQPAGDGAPAKEGAEVIAAQAAFVEEEATGERNTRKERVGVVVSDKMQKTIVVSIERRRKHPMYKKYLNRSARKMAHDENDDAGEGDTVRIMETRPISKHKRWRLVEILERAE